MADSSNTSASSHNFCLICRCDDRELMPCPVKNPNCSNGCCWKCLISAIDNDQRKPMRCQACQMKTTIEDYSTAIGFKNHTLVKRNQPKVDLSAIAAPVFFNDNEDMDQTEPGDQTVPGDQEMVDQSMDEVGPERVLCPGLVCQSDCDNRLRHLVKCQDCNVVFPACCIMREINTKGEFSCSCGWKQTNEEWKLYIGNENNIYREHPAAPYGLL